jgi:hypothetical protein
MAYILSAQRDQGEPEASRLWHEYQEYLRSNQARFPPGAYALAASDWYFGFSDHRAPHDAWLELATFEEPSTGQRHENRTLNLRIKLLGAYHDYWLEFFYANVISYSLANAQAARGHCDWRYDEFRLSASGNLVHEIEWVGPPGTAATWVIEASDVEFRAAPRDEA